MESFPWLMPEEAPYRFPLRTASQLEPLPAGDEGELALDVLETASDIVITAPIAGVKPEDLAISLHHDMLTVRGERKPAHAAKGRFLCRECHWGKFSRTVILPDAVLPDSAEATLKNGVLTIRLPKSRVGGSIPVRLVEE